MENPSLTQSMIIRSFIGALCYASLMIFISFYSALWLEFFHGPSRYPSNPLGPTNPLIALPTFILGHGLGFCIIWAVFPPHYEPKSFLKRNPKWAWVGIPYIMLVFFCIYDSKYTEPLLSENLRQVGFMMASLAVFLYTGFFSSLYEKLKKAQSIPDTTPSPNSLGA